MKDLFVVEMLKLLSRAFQFIIANISMGYRVKWVICQNTCLVLVPVPCVDCSAAKLFGGFLFICFFSSTTGSSFNIPIVSFDRFLAKFFKFISGHAFRWSCINFRLNISRTRDILIYSRWQDHCTTALTSSEQTFFINKQLYVLVEFQSDLTLRQFP